MENLSNDISVVMAVYNGAKFLREQFNSIITQTNANIIEIIFVDDCSADGSIEVLREFCQIEGRCRIIQNEANLGPKASFQKGAANASASYIAFADQDDIWLPEKLSTSLDLMRRIEDKGKPALVFTNLSMMDEIGVDLNISFWDLYRINPARNSFYTLLFGNIVTGCTTLVNQLMVGEFKKMPLEAAMHDHWLALISYSFGTAGYSGKCTVRYRNHGNSVTEKQGVGIFKKILNFLVITFNKDADYLNDYIKQAEFFKALYWEKINDNDKAALNSFISLRLSPGITKKIHWKLRFVSDKNKGFRNHENRQ